MTRSLNTLPGCECSGTLYLMTPSAPTPESRDNTNLAKMNELGVKTTDLTKHTTRYLHKSVRH